MENPFEIINDRLIQIEKQLQAINSKLSSFEDNGAYHPKIMDIKQLGEYLNLSKSRIYKLTSRHEIPHYKRGKKLYFDKDSINSWVMENKILTMDELEEKAAKFSLRKRR